MDNSKKVRKRRRIPGSRSYRDYSEEMLELAVDMVEKNRMSSREAEKRFGIPRRTILNKVKKKHMKPIGGQKKLTNEEEEKLVNVLIVSADYGSPMTKTDLKILVYKYLEKNSRTDLFDCKLPSDTWVDGFLLRHHSKLSIRTTQNIKKVRAEKGLEEMEFYFDNLRETLKDIPPTNILNYDETNLSDNPGTSKCVFRRGVKHPERILNNTKSCISIMFTASASGKCLPTYVVYKSLNLYSEWLEGGPDKTRYNCSKSGWFDTACFEDYFKTIIIEWAKQLPGPKVVIGDNLSSHINIEVVELCQKHNIRLVFLPPNSTHLTQPLDVAYFGPLKREWKKILLNYKIKNPGQSTLNKKHFPKLLSQLLDNMQHKESNNIINGFKATGIWPLNPRNVFKRIPEYFVDAEYSIDESLLNYLKETRAPKPIQVKRNKKLRTEPGKSVCVDDILTQKRKSLSTRKRTVAKQMMAGELIDQNKKTKAVTNNMSLDAEDEIYMSDEVTGEAACSKQFTKIENKHYDIQSTSLENINYGKQEALQQFLPVVTNIPSRLDIICIEFLNMYLGLSAQAQVSDVCLLNKVCRSDIQNTAFVAMNENDLPQCLRPKSNNVPTPRVIITSDKKATSKEINDIKKGIKSSEIITQSALQMKIFGRKVDRNNKNISLKSEKNSRKRKNVISDTKIYREKKKKSDICREEIFEIDKKKRIKHREFRSSSDTNTSDVISIADTDDSEYATYDEYIETCLKEMDEKENSEPNSELNDISTPFGLTDITYFTGLDLNKDDWVVVKFVTKKSLRHFVGQVLYIKNKIPTVNFLRKVNYSKSGKVKFTYPNVQDVSEINRDDVVLVLPQPNISRRGQIMFDVTFNSSYNFQ